MQIYINEVPATSEDIAMLYLFLKTKMAVVFTKQNNGNIYYTVY